MQRFKTFRKSEDGTMSVDAVIVLPFLLWVIAMTYGFWDLFHTKAVSQRAAYTIADTLSRETENVDATYLNGINNVHTYLMQGQHSSRLRVSLIAWNDTDSEFNVIWSKSPDANWTGHTDATLALVEDSIPAMNQGDVAIFVEAQVRFIPFMDFMLDPMTLETQVVTRPRFAPQLVWENADGTTVGYGSSNS